MRKLTEEEKRKKLQRKLAGLRQELANAELELEAVQARLKTYISPYSEWWRMAKRKEYLEKQIPILQAQIPREKLVANPISWDQMMRDGRRQELRRLIQDTESEMARLENRGDWKKAQWRSLRRHRSMLCMELFELNLGQIKENTASAKAQRMFGEGATLAEWLDD